jgi:hypothetical protein
MARSVDNSGFSDDYMPLPGDRCTSIEDAVKVIEKWKIKHPTDEFQIAVETREIGYIKYNAGRRNPFLNTSGLRRYQLVS